MTFLFFTLWVANPDKNRDDPRYYKPIVILFLVLKQKKPSIK
jgi:hypothetical protein